MTEAPVRPWSDPPQAHTFAVRCHLFSGIFFTRWDLLPCPLWVRTLLLALCSGPKPQGKKRSLSMGNLLTRGLFSMWRLQKPLDWASLPVPFSLCSQLTSLLY